MEAPERLCPGQTQIIKKKRRPFHYARSYTGGRAGLEKRESLIHQEPGVNWPGEPLNTKGD